MANEQIVQARRPQTITGGSSARDSAFSLPDDLLSEQVKRLALFCLIAAVLWTVGLLMDLFLVPLASGKPRNWRSVTLEVMAGLVSLVVGVYATRSKASTAHKSTVGVVFMLFNAAAIAALNTWAVPPPTTLPTIHLSWITIAILVYSMVAPHTPATMLATGL